MYFNFRKRDFAKCDFMNNNKQNNKTEKQCVRDQSIHPANIYLLKSTIETLEKGVKHVHTFSSANFEHVSHLFLVLQLLNLNR